MACSTSSAGARRDRQSVTTSEVAGGGSGSAVNLDTDTAYDALGRVLSSTDPTGTVSRYGYDRLGRLTSTILNYVDGTSTTTSDDVTSTFAYNAASELIGYCPANEVAVGGCNPASSSETQAWRYGYDDAGHLVSQLPPDNVGTDLAARFWTYEAGGRLDFVCDQVGGTSCSSTTSGRRSVPSYDAVGRVTRLDTFDRASGGQGSPCGPRPTTWPMARSRRPAPTRDHCRVRP
jgi:YD repeat-containing protein